ncbi:MAG: hypothetical protein H7A51_13635 [Akkermansiaceae bacterium]|nr:hypothetical protein [Akkermansiaceae bacterium]
MIRRIITRIRKMTFGLKGMFFFGLFGGSLLTVAIIFGSDFEDEATGEMITHNQMWESGRAYEVLATGLILVCLALMIYCRKKVVRILIPLALASLSPLHYFDTGELWTMDFFAGIIAAVIIYIYLNKSRWVEYYFSNNVAEQVAASDR